MKRILIRTGRIAIAVVVVLIGLWLLDYGGLALWRVAVGVGGALAIVWAWEIAFGPAPATAKQDDT